jgi:hypothetical protein
MWKVSNAELGEYLIGIEANIKCPIDYWKEDKVSWTIQVMDQTTEPRVRGGQCFLWGTDGRKHSFEYR